MTVAIRPIEQGDKQVFLALWEKYNIFYKRTVSAKATESCWTRMLDPDVKLYGAVAVEDSTVVGFVTWLPHIYTASVEDIVYLHDLYVSEDVRNGGIGRKLIEHVYEWAAKEGDIKSVYWHTQHFNHRAQLLYTKVADKTDFVQYSHTIKDKLDE